MLDIKDIRANPERLREAVRMRRVDPRKADVDRWLELDERRRKLVVELDAKNAERKALAGIGKSDPVKARELGQQLRESIRQSEEQLEEINKEWQAILEWFPNWPHPRMPDGAGEEDNVVESVWIPSYGYLPEEKLGKYKSTPAEMPSFPPHAKDRDFTPMHYAALGEKLGGIDTFQASQVSGTRFAYIIGDVALLQWGVTRLLIEKLLAERFTPIIPPLLVRERSLYGTSHFPEGRDQVYQIRSENVEEGTQLFLIGSSEPANFSYFMDRTLDEARLPMKVFASTPCFRSEAGSWGRDTKGIKRVHQFDKIEMNAVCTPAQSEQVYEQFRAINEWLLQSLELPYRVVDKSSGDAGYLATHRQRDVEAWLSGSQEFMEVMTDTNTTDYQARRLGIRFKAKDGKTQFAHTVNDTGAAMGRILISILDNYQQKDGSVTVPKVLQPLIGIDVIRPR